MAVNGTIKKTTFTDQTAINNGTTLKAKAIHITELRNAIASLESYATNVDNCGNCTACQTCQTTTCQSCQTTTCQKCQSCQTTSCQSCQSCQTGGFSCYTTGGD